MYVYTHLLNLLKDIWPIYIWLLPIKRYEHPHRFLCELKFSFFLGNCPRGQLLCHTIHAHVIISTTFSPLEGKSYDTRDLVILVQCCIPVPRGVCVAQGRELTCIWWISRFQRPAVFPSAQMLLLF